MPRTNGIVSGTPKARALGAALRDARNEANMSLRALGQMVDMDHTVLSRYESGERSPRAEDVASILMAVGVSGERREEILELSRGADDSRWLGMGLPEQHRQLRALLDIERTATRITDVSPLLVPGLLQTGDYARSIMMQGDSVPSSEIETRVAVRVGRRDALQRRNPAHLTALIGEAALRQAIGGLQVMVEQLEYLAVVAQWPNVDLRIVALNQDWHPGLEGPFSFVEFVKGDPLVHLETRASGLFLHEMIDVEPYRRAIDTVREAALPATTSAKFIDDAISARKKEME
jgi:transcriptional regulator with XRE-family HTH domain